MPYAHFQKYGDSFKLRRQHQAGEKKKPEQKT